MSTDGNIIIADESALHLYLHSSGIKHIGASYTMKNPLESCEYTSRQLKSFNTVHPLYGGEPVCLLTSNESKRRKTKRLAIRALTHNPPARSFIQLKKGLFATSPELTFVRMARQLSRIRLAEVGMALCARYYVRNPGAELVDREEYLTTPQRLADYVASASGAYGSNKAREALNWVMANSKSPIESKMKLQFCNPLWSGGFAMPFTVMNYDFKAGRLLGITEQSEYSIDLANPKLKIGLEYDGGNSHPDSGHDKRRRNALVGLGWQIFAIEWDALNDPEATEKTARQIAKHLGIRMRKPKCWKDNYIHLRENLGLRV